MKYNRFLAGFAVQILLLSLIARPAAADLSRTQAIQLHQGWNAVFLQVDPTSPKPADCFQGTPVTIAAAYIAPDHAVQYVQNPSTNFLTRKNGWATWYSPSRPDAFLSQLFSMRGNRPYLLYSESDYTWNVAGTALLTSVTWKPNSYSLVGFGVDDVSPPTFDQFFDGSPQHHPYQIYHLVNDSWTKVDSAQSTQMHSGEAYWIYCSGSSDYQGPLYAKLPVGTTFQLTGATPSGLTLYNNSRNPLGVTVQNVSGGSQLPLGYLLRAVTDSNVVTGAYDLPDPYSMPSFDAAEKRGFWLVLRTDKMNASTNSGLLKITTDLGTQCWLPITGSQTAVTSAN